jgi:predicted exporter
MRIAAVRVFLMWLLAMGAGVLVVVQTHFSTDMSFFLPARPTAEQQVLVDQLREGVVSRLLMVGLEGGEAAGRARLSRELRARLGNRGEFVSVQNGESSSLTAERDFLFAHRYLLSPAVTPARFTADGLHESIANSIDLLASPIGLLLKPYLTRDPSGELAAILNGFDSTSQPASREGVWASRDGERALLLIQTTALGSDTDGQEQAVALIRQQHDEAAQALGLHESRLLVSGPGLFAVKSRDTIKAEIHLLSGISTLAILVVLFFVYRSPRLILLGLLPVVSGALAGMVAVALGYGSVFGITVGFGSALIGEAVDFSIYYFVQAGRIGVHAWRQRFWPTVRLGVLTSVCGFGALLFSGFPGLAQLGLYALTGIATAALVTRFALPALAGERLVVADLNRLDKRLTRFFRTLPRWRGLILLFSAAALAYLVSRPEGLWYSNLSALSTVQAADAQLDQRLRNDLGAPDSRYMVVIRAADQEAALQAAERAGRQLDGLVAAGVIGGYDTPTRFLPSRQTQMERRQALPDSAELRSRLTQAVSDLPLRAERLEPFLAELEAARQAPLIDRATLNGSGLALAVDSLLVQRAGGWNVLLPLRLLPGSQGGMPVEQVRRALAGSGALFIDLKGEFDALYGEYIHEATLLSLAGFVAIVLLLAVTLRSPRLVGQVLLPLVLAVILVIAGVHLAGERLHLLHLVGMLLIIAVGSNYALFFASDDNVTDDGTLVSMAVANLTTAIGFGTLSLSTVPVLHAIGVTVGPGAVLALLLSACFAGQRASEGGEK